MSEMDRSYFLSPEFAKDSSTPGLIADLLSLASDNGLYNVVGIELGQLLDKYRGLVQLFANVYGQISSAPGAVDKNVRQDAAARFHYGAKVIANDINEQVSIFIGYLSDLIER